MISRGINLLRDKPFFLTGFIYAFWYLSLFPGRLSGDTSQAIVLIRNGESTDWWTGIYFQFLRVATFDGRILFIASAITLAVLYFAIFYLVESMPFGHSQKSVVLNIVLITPLAGAFGMNVSHDVFQASSILFLTGIEFRIVRKMFLTSKVDYLVEATLILTILMNHFGLIMALFHLIQILRAKGYKFGLFISVALIATYLIGGIGVDKSEMKSLAYPMIHDIKCIVQHPDSTVSANDWILLSKLAPMEEWKDKVTCRDQVNLLGALASLDVSALSSKDLAQLYFRIAAQNPYILVYQHIIRATVVLPPPFFQAPDNQIKYNREQWIGFDSNSELQNGPELLHSSLDLPELKLDIEILKPFEYLALLTVFIVNQASWFWSWAGLWTYPTIFLIFIAGVNDNKKYFTTLIPILLLAGFLLLLSPQSSGRYVMGTILTGFISLIILIRDILSRIRVRKSIFE